ncbi:hypothetical protein CYMTET_20018 [Cymbomonas tetramitiformis]|uniref:Uncharacterized protein n=1 Tax=Cymbomonas tetramitiformis TaxID=36881 RepID=A0AAE0G513_9CHLO|nr:hypothetical protein CYMTET_20018 [Cymbomonas tetramitiformis]
MPSVPAGVRLRGVTGVGICGSSAAVRVAPAVVSAGGIESDVDVSAYGSHVEEDSGSDGDDVLAKLHKITDKVHDVGRRAGVSFSQVSVPRLTQATVAVQAATVLTSRPAGQVVPTGDCYRAGDSTGRPAHFASK